MSRQRRRMKKNLVRRFELNYREHGRKEVEERFAEKMEEEGRRKGS